MAAVVDSTSSLPAEQKRVCLAALLDSETFARCDQLRSFLSYVGEMAIAGRSREVTEYLIAVQALGRPADFSPSEDSSVRSRAHELRRKLQKYYETEDPGASIRIELPKGSYIPRFIPQDHPDRAAAHEISLPVQPRPRNRSKLIIILAIALAISVAIIGGLSWQLLHQVSAAVDPVIAQAWGPLARRDANVLVCVGTVLHLVVRPYMSAVAEGLPKYSAPQELYPLYRQHRPLPPNTPLDMHPVDNSVQLGHMGAVVMLASTFQSFGAPYQILPERSAPVTVMRDRNVIIIGDPQNSSAAAKMLEETPFIIDYDAQLQDVVIRDRRPASARKIYAPKRGPDNRYTDAYGLLTVTPTAGAKRGQRTVTISGLTSVGSHGAAEFFTSADELRRMRDRFKSEGLAAFPASYQVVVKCKSSDTLLISAEYETHATIQK